MKTLFFDCTNGISGDMVLKALAELSGQKNVIQKALDNENFDAHGRHEEPHAHGRHEEPDAHGRHEETHAHGRSRHKVRELINRSSFSETAKRTALNIYENIAHAEAEVHGESLETVHFHEVGRDEAIKNALGIGMAIEIIASSEERREIIASSDGSSDGSNDGSSENVHEHGVGIGNGTENIEILTSPIYDGKGTVVCSHGEIPVPVPAVMALRKNCDYVFETADINTEMVTPSGLASLMGINAKPTDKTLQQIEKKSGDEMTADFSSAGSVSPRVRIIAQTEVKGTRNTGRDGLKVYLLEQTDAEEYKE